MRVADLGSRTPSFPLQEFDECLRVIEKTLDACGGLSEYPIYIKVC